MRSLLSISSRMLSVVVALLTLIYGLSPRTARAQLALGDDPAIDPSAFTVSVFASGLSFPYGMLRLGDGSLLVATSSTSASSGSFWSAPASIVRLADANDDGVADGPPSVLYSGLPARVTALARLGTLIAVSTASESAGRITLLRLGATPADLLTFAGRIDLTYANHIFHQNYTLASRPSPTRIGAFDLVFNIGSKLNDAATTSTVSLSGLVTAVVAPDALMMFTVQDDGASVVVDDLVQIGAGLRNAAGAVFDPHTGDLFFEDNGIDAPGNSNEPLSGDELNVLRRDEIGGIVEHFGFPDDYVTYRTGVRVGSGAVQPLAVFQPLPDPMTGAESEGATQIALSPPGFPAPFDRGLFIGFHGRFSTAGPVNDENAVVFYDPIDGSYLHFVPPGLAGVGHPDGLLASGDSLFIADFSSQGGFTGASGMIYRVRSSRITCEVSPQCVEAADPVTIWGVVQTPQGLGSFRCWARLGSAPECAVDATGTLIIGPPMCQTTQ